MDPNNIKSDNDYLFFCNQMKEQFNKSEAKLKNLEEKYKNLEIKYNNLSENYNKNLSENYNKNLSTKYSIPRERFKYRINKISDLLENIMNLLFNTKSSIRRYNRRRISRWNSLDNTFESNYDRNRFNRNRRELEMNLYKYKKLINLFT